MQLIDELHKPTVIHFFLISCTQSGWLLSKYMECISDIFIFHSMKIQIHDLCFWNLLSFKTLEYKSKQNWTNSPSQTHTLLSLLHVANSAPDWDHAALFTSFSWPSSVAMHSNSPPFLSQMQVVASKLAEARRLPHGDQVTRRMVLVWLSSRMVLHTHSSP